MENTPLVLHKPKKPGANRVMVPYRACSWLQFYLGMFETFSLLSALFQDLQIGLWGF